MSPANHVQHASELDPVLRSALNELLSQTPSPTQWSSARRRLVRLNVGGPTSRLNVRGQRISRLTMATAAGLAFGLLWLGSQSQAWGDVALDFQTARNDSQPAGVSSPADVGAGMKFLLLLHVASLLAGMACLAASWTLSQVRFAMGLWIASERERWKRWGTGALVWALGLQAAGITLGMIWAHLTWGKFWQWDPREAGALLVLVLVVFWY
ncbi:MAG: hypothetical protein MI861_01475, partial [Pirellulales bacterium]|nr:hypothetical protein [Pirellulales bacterium]